MEGLTADVVLGTGQLVALVGIFYRLGHLTARVTVLESATRRDDRREGMA